MKKWGVVVAAGALAASLALFGCSSQSAEKPAEPAGDDAATAEYTLMTEGTLTVLTSPDYPPFENLEGDEIVGLDIDIAAAVAEELGLEFEVKSLQFDGIITAVAAGGQGDIGVSGISVDPDRAKQVDFTESYYVDDLAIAVMKGGDITADNATEALNAEGMVIAVQTGTTGEDYVKENFPNATVQGYGNSTDAFAAMQAGQANAVCTNAAVVKQMLAQAYSDAEIVASAATGEEYAMAVSKDNPALLEALNAAIVKLTDDGTIEALTNKWMG